MNNCGRTMARLRNVEYAQRGNLPHVRGAAVRHFLVESSERIGQQWSYALTGLRVIFRLDGDERFSGLYTFTLSSLIKDSDIVTWKRHKM